MLCVCSVDRLLEILSCYDSSRALLLGEVYGYLAHTNAGFNFVTGGGRQASGSIEPTSEYGA